MVRHITMDVHQKFAQLGALEDGLARYEGRIGVTPEALRSWVDGAVRRRSCGAGRDREQ
jgi:hypothetical protein